MKPLESSQPGKIVRFWTERGSPNTALAIRTGLISSTKSLREVGVAPPRPEREVKPEPSVAYKSPESQSTQEDNDLAQAPHAMNAPYSTSLASETSYTTRGKATSRDHQPGHHHPDSRSSSNLLRGCDQSNHVRQERRRLLVE